MTNLCFSSSPSSVMISPLCPGRRSRLAASNSEGSTVPSHGAASDSRTISNSAQPPRRTDQLRCSRCHVLSRRAMLADSTERACRSIST